MIHRTFQSRGSINVFSYAFIHRFPSIELKNVIKIFLRRHFCNRSSEHSCTFRWSRLQYVDLKAKGRDGSIFKEEEGRETERTRIPNLEIGRRSLNRRLTRLRKMWRTSQRQPQSDDDQETQKFKHNSKKEGKGKLERGKELQMAKKRRYFYSCFIFFPFFSQ